MNEDQDLLLQLTIKEREDGITSSGNNDDRLM